MLWLPAGVRKFCQPVTWKNRLAGEWVWSRNNCFGDIFEEEEEFDDDCNDDKDEEVDDCNDEDEDDNDEDEGVDDCNDDDEDDNDEDEEFDDYWGEIILERHLLGQTCERVAIQHW